MKFKYGQIVKTPTGQLARIASHAPQMGWFKHYYKVGLIQKLPDGKLLMPLSPDAKFNEDDLTLWRSNSHIIKDRLGIK